MKTFVLGNSGTVDITVELQSTSPHFTLKVPQRCQLTRLKAGTPVVSGIDEDEMTSTPGVVNESVRLRMNEEIVVVVLLKTNSHTEHYGGSILMEGRKVQ